jgi:hypothetical protein
VPLGIARLGSGGLLRGDDEHRRIGVLRRFEPLALGGGQHRIGVLEHAGRSDDVIVGHRHLDFVIAEFEREFPAAQELLVVPAFVVRIDHHAREPLRHQEDVVAALARIIGEMFEARTRHHRVFLDDVEGPFDHEFGRRARGERLGQIDPHQRADDGVRHIRPGQRLHRAKYHSHNHCRPSPAGGAVRPSKAWSARTRTQRDLRPAPSGAAESIGQFRHRIALEDVLVELHPQPRQAIWRIVGVADGGLGGQAALGLVQLGGDLVIDLLLPVFMPRRTARGAIGVGIGQHLVKLAEFVLERTLGLLHALRCGRDGEQQGGDKQHETQGQSPEVRCVIGRR